MLKKLRKLLVSISNEFALVVYDIKHLLYLLMLSTAYTSAIVLMLVALKYLLQYTLFS